MFHIEHFVEGKYVKYNSNSGFVLREEENIRATPQVPSISSTFQHFQLISIIIQSQILVLCHDNKFIWEFFVQAFSHFTFERSGHQMIVVDVQGVGDLYTDPQIHTAKGDEYGEANLG